MAARDSWLAGNATEAKSREAAAAAAAAATWAGYVAGNVTATAKTWEGWLAGNTTQATNAVSGADTQVAAAEAALEACTEDLQAAADANATCAAWELPAVEADRDYWKQVGGGWGVVSASLAGRRWLWQGKPPSTATTRAYPPPHITSSTPAGPPLPRRAGGRVRRHGRWRQTRQLTWGPNWQTSTPRWCACSAALLHYCGA